MQMFSINEKKFVLVTVNFQLCSWITVQLYFCATVMTMRWASSTWVEISFEKTNAYLSLGDKPFIYGAMQNSTRRNCNQAFAASSFQHGTLHNQLSELVYIPTCRSPLPPALASNCVFPWLITKFDAIAYVRDSHPIANFCWIWFSREFPTKWWNIASVTVCTFYYFVLPRWAKTCEWIWANKNSKRVISSNDVPFVVWFQLVTVDGTNEKKPR